MTISWTLKYNISLIVNGICIHYITEEFSKTIWNHWSMNVVIDCGNVIWQWQIIEFISYTFQNKDWKINWSKQSFTGLGPEDRCSSWRIFKNNLKSLVHECCNWLWKCNLTMAVIYIIPSEVESFRIKL
jgi:hypothetical protein